MNILLYVLFLSIFSLDWISFKLGGLPRIATWLPEILSLMAAVLVVMLFAMRKHFALKRKYLIFFSLFFMFILGGIIVNKVPSGVVLAGLRSNLKYLPFFFLPIVYVFSDEQISRQLKFLLVLSLIQCPVTIYQRFIKYAGVGDGDVVWWNSRSKHIWCVVCIPGLRYFSRCCLLSKRANKAIDAADSDRPLIPSDYPE